MIVMQYANNGNLLSYLDQNINKLTWMDKLRQLKYIARYLRTIHDAGLLVHCDLHGGNIVLNNSIPYICKSNSTVRGILPFIAPPHNLLFIAPEIFHSYKFTQKSDIYSVGIIMYLIATGELPFRDREFDASLIREIMSRLRPSMPDSVPEEYKKLAGQCCDADPDKRPDAKMLLWDINRLFIEARNPSGDNIWNTIYHNDVRPSSCLEKE